MRDVSRPAELSEHQHGFNAGGVCSRQDLFVGDVVLPLDSHDGSQAPLVKAFQQFDLLSVEDPGFCPVEKGGEDCSPVNLDLG